MKKYYLKTLRLSFDQKFLQRNKGPTSKSEVRPLLHGNRDDSAKQSLTAQQGPNYTWQEMLKLDPWCMELGSYALITIITHLKFDSYFHIMP